MKQKHDNNFFMHLQISCKNVINLSLVFRRTLLFITNTAAKKHFTNRLVFFSMCQAWTHNTPINYKKMHLNIDK